MKGSILKYFGTFVSVVVLAKIFAPWLTTPEIIGGDWPHFFKESLQSLSFFSPSWNAVYGNGLGGPVVNYTLDQYLHFTAFLTRFYDFPWVWIYKMFWFFPVVLFSVYSTVRLYKTMFGDGEVLPSMLAVVIFATNTYILMLTAGGQMGIALAYSLTPLVLTYYILLARVASARNVIITGLVLALQVMLDLRVAYITLIAVLLYYLMRVSTVTLRRIFGICFSIGIPIVIAVVVHASWTLPLLFLRQNPFESLGQNYTAVDMVKFLSFADFPHAFSLLHPNWPENIFGKIYFMRPEFLVLPILAFVGLLFIGKARDDQKRNVLFLAVLALLGGFLAKGANPPLGDLYVLAFEKVPGFVMFRDATKFYLLVSLSFSMLIPFALSGVSSWLKRTYRFSSLIAAPLIFTAFLLFWSIMIREAVFSNLGGTFSKRVVPNDYFQLKDFLYSKPGYFRVLTVPRWQRFIYSSDMHPLVDASYLFNTQEFGALPDLVSKSQDYLSELSIRYIMIPDDSQGEIFLKDRKYDKDQYTDTVKGLEKIPWIKKVFVAGNIIVFETRDYKDRFWSEEEKNITYQVDDSTKYIVNVKASAPFTLHFSESYSPNWTAYSNNQALALTRSKNDLMQLSLDPGDHTVALVYGPEKYYRLGRNIAMGSVAVLAFYLLIADVVRKRTKKNDKR